MPMALRVGIVVITIVVMTKAIFPLALVALDSGWSGSAASAASNGGGIPDASLSDVVAHSQEL